MPKKTKVLEPDGWKHVQSSYLTIRGKMTTDKSGYKTDPAQKKDLLDGIDYWIARLNEDKTAVALEEDLPEERE